MELLLVGLGGMLGSLSRYLLGKTISEKLPSAFPAGTFVINSLGAFLLGVAVSAGISGRAYLFCADGFLGAFTTFSTFTYEGFSLIQRKDKRNAVLYTLGSVLFGLLLFTAGFEVWTLF
jgi:fluoride exporter